MMEKYDKKNQFTWAMLVHWVLLSMTRRFDYDTDNISIEKNKKC